MTVKYRLCKHCGNRSVQVYTYTGKTATWRCQTPKCDAPEFSTPARKVEIKKLENFLKTPPHRNVHCVWHEFTDKFKKWQPSSGEEVWRWAGYKLMCKIEEWAKKHPRFVTVTSCDDDMYMGSRLVAIEHRSPDGRIFQGTSMVFLHQVDGKDPAVFFLYPGHHDQLLKCLTTIKKRNKDWKYSL